MSRIFVIVYALGTGGLAIYTTLNEIPPSLFLINLFEPLPGNTYDAKLVMVLTWLLFLSPLFLYGIIAKRLRNKKEESVDISGTGIFVSRKQSFQSTLVAIPIYINNQKAGTVDNGRTKFFSTASGAIAVCAGKGKQSSEKLQVNIADGEQLRFELEIIDTGGIHLTYKLTQL